MTEVYERTFAQFVGLTTSAPAGAVFQDEILGSSITTVLEGLSVRAAAAKVYVHFAGVLTGPELTTFDGLVTAHDGVPYTEQTRTAPVLDRHLSTPPGSPAAWARYIVGPSPTGAWANWENYVVEWDSVAWTPARPMIGTMVYAQDEAKDYQWTGSAWTEVGGGSGGTSIFGQDMQYEESLGTSSTTSASWKTKVGLTTPVGLTGTYRVAASGRIRNDGDIGQYRLYNNTDGVTLWQTDEKWGNAGDVNTMTHGFGFVVCTGSAKTFLLQYRDRYGGHTTQISHARIEFWRVS